MDQRERVNDPIESLRVAIEGQLVELWTHIPAIIQDFDPQECTCSAQPSIQAQIRKQDGSIEWVNLPLLIHVPVIFPRGGGFTLTFPIKHGDEALIHFSSRCIDEWWRQGDIQKQTSLRIHDLHDGFAEVGMFSKPNVISNISTDTVQLRSDDGSCSLEFTGDGRLNIKAPGGINIQGTLTSDSEGTFNGHTVGAHTHTDPQGGVTSPPTG